MGREGNTYQPSVSPFGDSRHRFPSQGAPQQDHRRGPRPDWLGSVHGDVRATTVDFADMPFARLVPRVACVSRVRRMK
eukprot:7281642-Prymnesium_polylepis.1